MALLVDSRIELDDGTVADGMTWIEAERTIGTALGGEAPRLYNRFARDYGDGFTRRTDLSPDQRAALERVRQALASSAGVRSIAPRNAAASAPAR